MKNWVNPFLIERVEKRKKKKIAVVFEKTSYDVRKFKLNSNVNFQNRSKEVRTPQILSATK